jgi:hypothetical protein
MTPVVILRGFRQISDDFSASIFFTRQDRYLLRIADRGAHRPRNHIRNHAINLNSAVFPGTIL